MEESTKSNAILNDVERGLRAKTLKEQIDAIMEIPSLLRQNPFPFFVNATALRLCETFREGCNKVRLCLLRVVEQCTDELLLVFSRHEIARRLLKVSHSNDVVARSLTLHMLANLAVVLLENIQIHSLVIASLDSSEKEEQLAAVFASRKYVSLSKSFSLMIVEKLSSNLLSLTISSAMKLRLINLLAKMNADVHVIHKVFELGESFLRIPSDKRLVVVMITSLTALANDCHYLAPKLFDLLLIRLRTTRDEVLCIVLLTCIKKLRSAVHLFTVSQIKELCQFGHIITYRSVLKAWLTTLNSFCTQNVNIVINIMKEYCVKWSYHLPIDDMPVRISAIHLYVNIFSRFYSPTISCFLQSSFLMALTDETFIKSEKFFRLLTLFLRQKVSYEVANAIVEAALLASKLSAPSEYFILFLISAAESHPDLYPRLSEWASLQLIESPKFAQIPLLAHFVYSPSDRELNLETDHLNRWSADPWKRYLVARTAMRNGHSQKIAKKIFETLETEVETHKSHTWIMVLKYACAAQLSDLNVDALDCTIKNYHNALCFLSHLRSIDEFKHCFYFAERFLENILSFYCMVRRILITLNMTISLYRDSQNYSRFLLVAEIRACIAASKACYNGWESLYRRCFDADSDTLDTLESQIALCSVINAGLELFIDDKNLRATYIPMLNRLSVANRRFCTAVVWMETQFKKFGEIPLNRRLSYANWNALTSILRHVCCLPLCFPRLFFQQRKSMQVKLNIVTKPLSKTDVSSFITRNEELSISIEGAVEFTHSPLIETIIVKSSVKFRNGFDNLDFSQQEMIPAKEDKFFNAIFLIKIRENCVIEFTVSIVDKKRRIWETDAKVQLQVTVVD